MNIFYLDECPKKSASMLCDKHILKMSVEYAQILSTAHHVKGVGEDSLYKATHSKHPSVVWACASVENYLWLYAHWRATLNEYTKRYKKIHASQRLALSLAVVPLHLREEGFSHPPLVMPEEYRGDCPVLSYRLYYKRDKSSFAKWKLGNIPKWMDGFENLEVV